MDNNKNKRTGNSETSQDSKSVKGHGTKPPSEKTIGVVLRDEREKKKLSYAQLSEITRLRPSVLEALENESWNELPSPAFARGFIFSYGHALGLQEEELNTLYRKSGPVKLSAPKPLAEPAKSRKASLVILVLILLSFISVYYLWKGYSKKETTAFVPNRIIPTKSITKDAGKTTDALKNPEKPLSSEQKQIETASVIIRTTDVIKEPDFLVEEEKETSSENIATSTGDLPVQELTLKADIREETWVKITVDNNESKEFMFTPGRHYEWKAKKGFELMIGNAGGIDLEFNGEAVAKPSTSGRVVSLKLP